MSGKTRRLVLTGILVCSAGLGIAATVVSDDNPPMVEEYLSAGRLVEGEAAIREHLEKHPEDSQARFGLGMLQFVRGVERLTQSLHRYGLKSPAVLGGLPFLRLTVGENPNPETITYEKFRSIFLDLERDLKKVDRTLAQVNGDVKLPLHFGKIRLDLNGDGTATEKETLWRIYAQISRNRNVTAGNADRFVIGFDTGDVHWLRGYCNLLLALDQLILAHDTSEQFHRTGQLYFAKVDSPYKKFRATDQGVKKERFNWADVADSIALIHLINFPVVEPERMIAAHTHLKTVIDQGRLTWKAYESETDDDHEWIPNANQKSVLPGARVDPGMIAAWREVLDEMEAILDGKKLIPYWRNWFARSNLFNSGRSNDFPQQGLGINFKRVFTEPRRFDLVLWLQGSGVEPYLEEGQLSHPDTWGRFNRAFQGQMFGFAIWFN